MPVCDMLLLCIRESRACSAGGTVGQQDEITADVECFCPVACAWMPAPSMAVPRSGMAVAAL